VVLVVVHNKVVEVVLEDLEFLILLDYQPLQLHL